jgi:hypothetical protein
MHRPLSCLRIKLVRSETQNARALSMSHASEFLLTPQKRARWMRSDTAQLLKRFFSASVPF